MCGLAPCAGSAVLHSGTTALLGPKDRRPDGYVRGSEVLVIGSGWCAPAT